MDFSWQNFINKWDFAWNQISIEHYIDWMNGFNKQIEIRIGSKEMLDIQRILHPNLFILVNIVHSYLLQGEISGQWLIFFHFKVFPNGLTFLDRLRIVWLNVFLILFPMVQAVLGVIEVELQSFLELICFLGLISLLLFIKSDWLI